jgi:hypothetical protein
MANQITIDIVAQTQKLTSGINDANTQIDGMSTKLKGAAAAAGAAASAFVLKQGVTFLKQGIDEAKQAQEAMRGATATFGEGSAALAKITADADKFGKQIAVDNDEIIKLATQLGSRLPADSKAASAELVNLAYDVSAYTGGALSAEMITGKLSKAFADGKLKVSELTKIFPDLEASVYAQAEALSKAGDNQGALNLLVEAGQKKYGDAAEKNVTASQRLDTTLANLKETIGMKLLPTIETLINFVTTAIDKFTALPGPVQNVILGLTALVAIGGPVLTFLASAKTAMEVLGITTGEYTIAQRLANFTIMGFPGLWVIAAIVAVIAIIVLLVKNWDTVTAVVGKVWNAIKNFASDAWDALKGFGSKVAGFVTDIVDRFKELPGAMLSVGKNIVIGLWDGIQNMASWLKDKVTGFFKNLVPSWAEKALGIASPSKVFANIGSNIINGLQSTFNAPAVQSVSNRAQAGIAVPRLSLPSLQSKSGTNIVINAGLGTNGAALGRQVSSAIRQYGKVSTQARF